MLEISEKLLALIQKDLSPKEKCLSFLKKAIFLGYVKKGQRIVERDLVDLLKISRPPVREAIHQLAGENLVAHYPNKGCVVVGLTARDIKEIYELRMTLECFVVHNLSDGARSAELEAIKQQLQEHFVKDTAQNFRFHRRLFDLLDHSWLKRFLGQIEEYTELFYVFSYVREGRKQEAFDEHIAVLDALIAQDAAKAQDIIKAHIAGSQRDFLNAAASFYT